MRVAVTTTASWTEATVSPIRRSLPLPQSTVAVWKPASRRLDAAPGGRVGLEPERAVGIREGRVDRPAGRIEQRHEHALQRASGGIVDRARYGRARGSSCEAEETEQENVDGERANGRPLHGAPLRRVLAPISAERDAQQMEKDGPAPVSWLADRCSDRRLPTPLFTTALGVSCSMQWRPASGSGSELPAYSGGTAWDSHPLRVVAGKNPRV